jgi:hypothetical protein
VIQAPAQSCRDRTIIIGNSNHHLSLLTVYKQLGTYEDLSTPYILRWICDIAQKIYGKIIVQMRQIWTCAFMLLLVQKVASTYNGKSIESTNRTLSSISWITQRPRFRLKIKKINYPKRNICNVCSTCAFVVQLAKKNTNALWWQGYIKPSE